MTERIPIELAAWPRREMFLSYLGTDFPYINMGCRMDVTGLLAHTRREGLSFYFALIWLSTRVADSIPNFRWRFTGEQVWAYAANTPVLTHLPRGTEQFVMVEGPTGLDMAAFCREVRRRCDKAVPGGRLDATGRQDIISYSCIPWVDYTHFIRTIKEIGVDCNPKLSWGRYVTENGRTTLNYSVQVHHGLMDGYHVGLFFRRLQEELDKLG